jgi:hypothetical protein
MGNRWMNMSTGRMTLTGENTVGAPLRPPQMPYRLAWNLNRASAKRDQKLTAWAWHGRTEISPADLCYQDVTYLEHDICVNIW